MNTRQQFVSSISTFLQNSQETYEENLYRQCTNLLYLRLFGMNAEELRQEYGLGERENVRRHLNTFALEIAETRVAEMVNEGISPVEAIERLNPIKILREASMNESVVNLG